MADIVQTFLDNNPQLQTAIEATGMAYNKMVSDYKAVEDNIVTVHEETKAVAAHLEQYYQKTKKDNSQSLNWLGLSPSISSEYPEPPPLFMGSDKENEDNIVAPAMQRLARIEALGLNRVTDGPPIGPKWPGFVSSFLKEHWPGTPFPRMWGETVVRRLPAGIGDGILGIVESLGL